MGKLLDSYLANYGTSIMSLAGAAGPSAAAPRQRGGARTFGLDEAPPAPGLTFSQPDIRSRRDVRQANMNPPPATFTQQPQMGPAPAAPQAGPTPAFQPQGPAQIDEGQLQRRRNTGGGSRRRRKSPDEVKAVEDLWDAADDEQIDAGINVLEKQLGGPQGMARAYEQVTGQPVDDTLSKRDIGTLLMEFGLRTLAYNDQSAGGLGAVGKAGAETLGMARAMKQAKREAPAKAERERLENRLIEAQVKKAEADPTELTSDASGRLILVNKADGSSIMITDDEGNPVTEGGDAAKFASQVDREAYESAFCSGLSGDAAKECTQRALAFSKGGAASIAFPQLQRQDLVLRMMTRLEDADNAGARYTVPGTGQVKAWRNLTEEEKLQVGESLIDRWNEVINRKAGETGSSFEVPAQFQEMGITAERLQRITPNTRSALLDGDGNTVGYIANRDGKYVRTDTDGRVIEPE